MHQFLVQIWVLGLHDFQFVFVEDQLRRNGAQAENKETLADKHTVVVDQRIVSSMFLPSAALVAEEMVRLLAREGP
mgnify:CR=1 FL=1